MKTSLIIEAYQEAKQRYAEAGIDTEAVLSQLQQYQLTLCFEPGADTDRGATPRNAEQFEQDMQKAMSLVGGKHQYEAQTASILQYIYTCVARAREAQIDKIKSLLKTEEAEEAWILYDEFCRRNDVPARDEYLEDLDLYVANAAR